MKYLLILHFATWGPYYFQSVAIKYFDDLSACEAAGQRMVEIHRNQPNPVQTECVARNV